MSKRFNSEFMHNKMKCIARLRKVTLFPICGNNPTLQLIQSLFFMGLEKFLKHQAKAKYRKKIAYFVFNASRGLESIMVEITGGRHGG